MKKRILLLDDEMDFVDLMKATLELTGEYEVRSTVRSSTFLQVAHDFKPDLILLDCMMPSLDGGEIAGQLQADPILKDTPFLFLTATADAIEQKTSRCYAGVQTYLPKSLGLDELFQFIKEKLNGQTSPGV
jgi:CheY-like chemotaxis protein